MIYKTFEELSEDLELILSLPGFTKERRDEDIRVMVRYAYLLGISIKDVR